MLDAVQKNPMRIACVGNIANNFYREVAALRKHSDIDAVLYLRKGPGVSNTALPESDDPKLINSYPDWIHVLPEFPKFNLFSALGYKPKSPECKALIDELNSYDICIFSSVEVFFIQYLKTCTIYRATGSDLTVFPVLSFQQFYQLRPKRKIDFRMSPLKSIHQIKTFYLRRNIYRKALQKSSFINSSPAMPCQIALDNLKIPKKRRIRHFRLAIDTGLFSGDKFKAQRAAERWKLHGYDYIVFIPSRMMIKRTKVHKITGQWKASDVAIRAYKFFLDSLSHHAKSKVVLLIPDRTQSDDLDLAKGLISELKIEDKVKLIEGDSKTGLTRQELIQLYSISDVVLADFGPGWYGSVLVEAMSCSCPVINYVSEEITRQFSWHPIQNAQTEAEISSSLRFLYNHPAERKQLGAKSRRWVEEFHSESAVGRSLADSLKALAY